MATDHTSGPTAERLQAPTVSYDDDHVPVRHEGDCIHYMPRLQCRICPPVETQVRGAPCPSKACAHQMRFGHFGEHVAHAPKAPLFVRRELARQARLKLAHRHGYNYPAYLIFDDATLDRISMAWPSSASIFEGYFGEARLEAWGRDFLRIILEDDGEPEAPPSLARRSPSPDFGEPARPAEPLVPLAAESAQPRPSVPRQPARRLGELLYEEILPRLAIEDAYADVDFVIRRGQYWRGGCPLHGGKDPNFSVNTATLSWNCFSHCGHGSYLAYLNGGEVPRGSRFIELVEQLAERVGVDVDSPADGPAVSAAMSRGALLDAYVALSREALASPEGEQAVRYLHERGFSGDARGLGRMGFGMHPGPVALAKLRADRGTLSEAGLDSSLWRDRLVIPWNDNLGRVATIAARAIDGSDPKYLYLRGARLPPFFRPARGRRHRIDQSLVITEGLIDAIALDAAGVENVVGAGGTAVNDEHVAWILDSGVRSVVVAFDADNAGVQAARKLAGMLQPHGERIHVTAVPPEAYLGAKDPAALIARDGASAAAELTRARLPMLLWEAVVQLGDATPASAMSVRRAGLEALAGLAKAADGPQRAVDLEDLVGLATSRLGYSEGAVRLAFGLPTPPEAVVIAVEAGSLADDIVAVLQTVGQPLRCAMITHVLRASAGPVTQGLIAAHRLTGLPSAHLPGTGIKADLDAVELACRGDDRVSVTADKLASLVAGAPLPLPATAGKDRDPVPPVKLADLEQDIVRVLTAVGAPISYHTLTRILRNSPAAAARTLIARRNITDLPSRHLPMIRLARDRSLVRAACASSSRIEAWGADGVRLRNPSSSTMTPIKPVKGGDARPLIEALFGGSLPPRAKLSPDEVVWSIVDELGGALPSVLSLRYGRYGHRHTAEEIARLLTTDLRDPLSADWARGRELTGLSRLAEHRRLSRLAEL